MGGVLNLTLSGALTEEECLHIVEQLKNISQNKFYTINVFDVNLNRYVGDAELLYKYGEYYVVKNMFYLGGHLIVVAYHFYLNGRYERTVELDIDISMLNSAQ